MASYSTGLFIFLNRTAAGRCRRPGEIAVKTALLVRFNFDQRRLWLLRVMGVSFDRLAAWVD